MTAADAAGTGSTRRSSTARAIAVATVVAAVAACVANTVIALLARAAGADATVVVGLGPAGYLPFTVIGVLLGAVGWAVVRRWAARPAAVLRWLVPAVVLVSLVPDIGVGLGTSWVGAAGLAAMHIAVALIAVPVYRRFLALPDDGSNR